MSTALPLPVSGFRLTLALLEETGAAQVHAFGAAFDWTLPVAFSRPLADKLVDDFVAPADELVEHGSIELLRSLLRQDMFNTPLPAARDSIRYKRTAWSQGYDTQSLWRSAWCSALSTGNLERVRLVEQAGGASFEPWLVNSNTNASVSMALAATPRASRPALLAHLFEAQENPLLRGLRSLPAKEPVPADVAARERLACQLFAAASEWSYARQILSALPGRPTKHLLTDLFKEGELGAKGLTRALSLLEFASGRGGFREQGANGSFHYLAPGDHVSTIVMPMDVLADKLATTKMPAISFQRIATRMLAWPTDSPIPAPSPTRLANACARHCAHWSDEVFQQVRAIQPMPSARELAWLILGAKDVYFQQRRADFLASAPQEAVLADFVNSIFTRDSKPGNFPRFWERAASLAVALSTSDRDLFDGLLRGAAAKNYSQEPEVGQRMVAVYETACLELGTAPATSTTKIPARRL